MSAINWDQVDWWDLPGPSRFIERAIDRIAADEGGVVGLSIPARRPAGLMGALADTLEQGRGLRTIVVEPEKLDSARSPAHALAAAAGAQPGTIRSTKDFVASPELAGMVILVDLIPPERWSSWGLFFRSLRAERLRLGRVTAPSLAVVVPQSLPLDEVDAALGIDRVQWRNVVSRADMQLYVESILGRSSDLAHRTAVATVAEVACWDPAMVQHLATQPIEDQIDPREMLAKADIKLDFPSWSNGLIDIVDGAPHVHTLKLVGSPELLSRRIWRAHVSTVFPVIEQVRQAFARHYHALLAVRVPYVKAYQNGTTKTYSNPMQLEINEVYHFLKDDMPEWQVRLLHQFRTLRSSMAHMEPADADVLVRASQGWNHILRRLDDVADVVGWDWPRCGQRLIMLVGPSGAGKSTYARTNYAGETIVSSDAIREELSGAGGMAGSQDAVFAAVRDRAKAALAAGKTVVIDATNLRRSDRLMNTDLVPEDIPIEYVVIDRPMAEKERDGGWRLEKPQLLSTHAKMFEAELSDILAGDNRGNVTVLDRRILADSA